MTAVADVSKGRTDMSHKTQNLENDLFNSNITFYISLKLLISFGLGRHLLRQDIAASTDTTLGCFKQNSFNIHIR